MPLGDRDNMMFMGNSVAVGTAQVVVVAPAMHTELGRIAGLIEESGVEEGTPLQQKLNAFAVLIFAELLRSFGGRSATKPLWRIPFLSNRNLAVVVAVSFGLQVWSHHNEMFRRFLKTSFVPLADDLWLLALGTIPLLILEMVKLVRNKRRRTASAGQPFNPTAPL
jgi:magnesium-transporting ATPase (P-type)